MTDITGGSMNNFQGDIEEFFDYEAYGESDYSNYHETMYGAKYHAFDTVDDTLANYKEFVPPPGRALRRHTESMSTGGSAATEPDVQGEENCLSDDSEPSLIEYARHYGLTREYYIENPFRSTALPSPPGSVDAELQDPDNALNIGTIVSINALNGKTADEKLDVDADTIEFLTSVMSYGKEDYSDGADNTCRSTTVRELKLEEAILPTDSDRDLLQLKRRNMALISSEGLEPFELDIEKDQSYDWPSKDLQQPHEINKLVATERLEVDRSVVEYLKGLSSPAVESYESILESLNYESVSITASPPLLPLSPPLHPQDLSASLEYMELTSTPENLIAKEAADVERTLISRDTSTPNALSPDGNDSLTNPECKEIHSTLHTPINSSSSPIRHKRKSDLKAEVPLTPIESTVPPSKKTKTVSFPEELLAIISRPESGSSGLDEEGVDHELGAFIDDVVMPLAESVNQQIEDEQLVELDTTMRVQVPPINEVLLMLPWKDNRDAKSPETALSRTVKQLERPETIWGGVSKVERLLPWSPFPVWFGKIQEDEVFDDGSLARYLAKLTFEDSVEVQDLLWKPDGLRILDEQDDDYDELERIIFDHESYGDGGAMPSITPHPLQMDQDQPQGLTAAVKSLDAPVVKSAVAVDMQTLLRKRKQELEASKPLEGHDHQDDIAMMNTGKPKIDVHKSLAQPTKFKDHAAGGGLSSFLHLHGKSIPPTAIQNKDQTEHHDALIPAIFMKGSAADKTMETRGQIVSWPTPQITAITQPVFAIVSSVLIANHQLIRDIQRFLPTLDITERDDAFISNKNSQSKSRRESACEADITISAGTGLIITTLQKLKQKPLPGQSSFFGICERIEAVSVRYERLLVLVGAGLQTTQDSVATPPMDNRDTEALSDLIGVASMLDADLEVYYIPASELNMAQWIASIISQHTTSNQDAKLMHEETTWELMLRKAGMNAFAAQAILSKFKMPRNDDAGYETSSASNALSDSDYGLAAYLRMTHKERVQRFGLLMGGDRVLSRVSTAIDEGWVSAFHQ